MYALIKKTTGNAYLVSVADGDDRTYWASATLKVAKQWVVDLYHPPVTAKWHLDSAGASFLSWTSQPFSSGFDPSFGGDRA
jgi:hypothetical protein